MWYLLIIQEMGDLLSHMVLVILLIPSSSSGRVTVQPSKGNPQLSAQVTWPESTNSVATTFQCSGYQLKLTLYLENTESGFIELQGRSKPIRVYCKDAGDKKWFDGTRWFHDVGNSGMCNTGQTETLIIQWTQEKVKVMKGNEVIMSQKWGPTDGHCLEKTMFWTLTNFGDTVVSAENILIGTYF